MTNKESKYPSNKNRIDTIRHYGVEGHGRTNSNRRLEYNYKHTNMIASEQSRAQLISQIIGSPERNLTNEFASYFHQPVSKSEPTYLLTSHKVEPRLRNSGKGIVPPIPAYPSMVHSLRWSPYIEVSSAEDTQAEAVDERRKFICRCENCTMKSCPSKLSSVKSGIFKDNIMTFRNQYTMTPKLNDACCGVCTPISTPKMSNVSVTASDIAVRDTQTLTQIQEDHAFQKPNMQRSKYIDPACKDYGPCHTYLDEAVRDTDIGNDYHEYDQPDLQKMTFTTKKKLSTNQPHEQYDNSRKVLYNEGISDSIANNYAKVPIRAPSPANLTDGYSRVSVVSKHCDKSEDKIPFCHRHESKYHYSCKGTSSNNFYYDSDMEEVRHLIASPTIIRRTCTGQRQRLRTPLIMLPKKLLTSEPDIESYIDKSSQETVLPALNKYKK
ncbi:uncharacterized protein LOC131849489 [Achroia grisella]|uniref:uncharacterized protein LOC131849489 n=1 Tax=Achroia grisella TaxID=688607 RepID=UPI0027D31B33|nr:uncharacterized protein LOC131849489 [Achroia grisella]